VDGATAVLAIAGNSDTVGAVSLKNGGSITGSGGTLTGASYAVESGSVSAKLGGSGIALTKSTAGTVTLSGVNTYTGATLITGGTLALGASGTIDNTSEVSLGTVGTFDVSAKGSGYTVGTLKGSGNVTGALTVSTTLAIGNSPGTTNFSGNLTLDSATYVYEMTSGASPVLGSADLGNVTGVLTISAGSILDLVELGTYTAGNKFTLFGYGTLVGTFDGLLNNATFLDDLSNTWQITYDDTTAGANGGTGTNFVTITAIPEPNAAALLGGLGVLVLLRRRR
jgi:autotransporter-associated beta strand protein